uniref:Uncharacterized protein n=1 Tax=Candidatus Kentrum sp. DK TaxID=2126562 RepID=A0A450TAP0_9GAMM|nr:MAG: hypothetical protein BECKDK2373C_GA0170839_111117 [Candidatus Kentron sp. DK]
MEAIVYTPAYNAEPPSGEFPNLSIEFRTLAVGPSTRIVDIRNPIIEVPNSDSRNRIDKRHLRALFLGTGGLLLSSGLPKAFARSVGHRFEGRCITLPRQSA